MRQKSFFQDVAAVVELIPHGKVTTYGAIAEYLGTKGSARMVGYAMHTLIGAGYPAHRVVNRTGKLTGHLRFENPTMAERLIQEGVLVEENQILNFEHHFWNPSTSLHL